MPRRHARRKVGRAWPWRSREKGGLPCRYHTSRCCGGEKGRRGKGEEKLSVCPAPHLPFSPSPLLLRLAVAQRHQCITSHEILVRFHPVGNVVEAAVGALSFGEGLGDVLA